MARCHLRIFHADENFAPAAKTGSKPATVTLEMHEILPLLADAVNNNRTWLQDFDNDDITISADLYEVILAYQHCRRPVA